MADLVPIPLDLFDRLKDAGLDVDAILRRAKLPRARFSVPEPQGTTAEFFALWRAVEELSGADPSLGLRTGLAVLPDDNNVVSLVAMHSATLGESLDRLARYKRFVWPRADLHRGQRWRGSTSLRVAPCLRDAAADPDRHHFRRGHEPGAARDRDPPEAATARAQPPARQRGDAPEASPLRTSIRCAA